MPPRKRKPTVEPPRQRRGGRRRDDTVRSIRTLAMFDMLAPSELAKHETILPVPPELLAEWRNRDSQ